MECRVYSYWRWKVVEPRTDKLYAPIRRGRNPWLVLGLLVGFVICLVLGFGLVNFTIYGPELAPLNSLSNIVGWLMIYIAVIFLFIFVLAFVGELRS